MSLDLRSATLNVERAINLGAIKPTKTSERRTVDLSRELLRALHRHLVWLKSEGLRRGWGEPAWLFPNDVKWIPSQGRRWVEVLDRADFRADLESGTKKWNQAGSAMQVVAQALEKIGEPSGTRTQDPLIKSQVLFRLS